MSAVRSFFSRPAIPLVSVAVAPRLVHRAPRQTLRCPVARNALRQTTPFGRATGKSGKDLRRGELIVRHAILGVGAPEAVLVVVVALVVFGPKGLAEAARGLGAMLRSFTPAIRELAEVSTDLKSSLEQEIGLEEIKKDLRNAVTTESAAEMDPEIEAKRAESAKLAWGDLPPPEQGQSYSTLPVSASEEAGSLGEKVELGDLSTEALEAELQRRKKTESETA